jgi:hypothetical protein
MGASYLIGILLFAWSAISGRGPRLPKRLPSGNVRVALIALACAVLCALFVLQLAAIGDVARSLLIRSPYGRDLPLPVIGAGYLYSTNVDAARATVVELAGIVQGVCLFTVGVLLCVHEKRERLVNVILGSTALVLTGIALTAPAMESADLYSYVGLALSANPYDPSATPFLGDAAIISRLWGTPLLPSPYGPLWLLISKAVVVPLGSLTAQLFALRLLELACLAACLLILRGLKVNRAVIALIAINPAVYDLFVAEGHNDIVGVALLLGAMLARPRSRFLAIALAAAAGLIKLPFAFLAMLVFVPESPVLRRLLLGVAPAVVTVAVSAVFGGAAYARALHRVYQAYSTSWSPLDSFFQGTLVVLALASVLLAVTRRKFIAGAVWTFPALGHFALPQYLAWSFPYAVAGSEPPLVFFAALPAAVYLLNTDFAMTPLFLTVRVVLCVTLVAAGIVHWLRYPRATRRGTARAAHGKTPE